MYRQREQAIRRWFDMWLQGKDLGLDQLFEPDCVYIESWGPRYDGIRPVKHWFREWNTRGRVLEWEIKQFFHGEDQSAVEWYFHCVMKDGTAERFDGVSVIEWSEGGKIRRLQEFGSKLPHYNPYEHGDTPLQQNSGMWT